MKIVWFVFAGIVGGILGGMGLGGGTLLIPLLSVVFPLEQKVSQAINLVAFVPMAIVALILHFKNGLVDKRGIWLIIIPAVLCAVLGSFLSKNLNEVLLKKLFGGFLCLLAVVVFIVAKKNKRKENSQSNNNAKPQNEN